MLIKTIKRNNGDNVVLLFDENNMGVRLLLTQEELIRLNKMLSALADFTPYPKEDTLVERKEATFGIYGFRHVEG